MKHRKLMSVGLVLAAGLGTACSANRDLAGPPATALIGASPVADGVETPRALPRQVVIRTARDFYEVSKAARNGEAVTMIQPEYPDPIEQMVQCGIASNVAADPSLREACGIE